MTIHSTISVPDSGFERHGFRYQIAVPQHDAEIARLLNDNEIPGWVSLSYRTQPGWHQPLLRSVRSNVVIGLDRAGRAGGIATRSVHRVFMGGHARPVGWLGQLRIDRPLRNRPHLLRAGFEAVETLLHDPVETPHYYASIIEDNDPARRILEKGLSGFPRFEPLFGYQVLAISTGAAGKGSQTVTQAISEDMPGIADFLNAQNANRDLAPHVYADGFVRGDWAGLKPCDFLVGRSAGEIRGVAAVWDQHPHRSIRVTGYRAPLSRLRWLANLSAPLSGLPKLPPAGADLRQAYMALATVEGDDGATWTSLINAALRLARSKGCQLLAVGFADGDPAAAAVSRAFRHRTYRSTIYRVTFAGTTDQAPVALRRPKLEIGLL